MCGARLAADALSSPRAALARRGATGQLRAKGKKKAMVVFQFCKGVLLAAAMVCAAPASAERFTVALGNRTIGSIDVSISGANLSMTSTLDNTPLGAADGRITATSRPGTVSNGAAGRIFRTERPDRNVTIEMDAGRVVATVIDPASERTDASDPRAVTARVSDPVQVMAALIRADGCPRGFRQFDGRRVVEAGLRDSVTSGTTLTCNMAYRVVAGPGHVSPFGIRNIDMVLTYSLNSGQRLEEVALTAAGFTITLAR